MALAIAVGGVSTTTLLATQPAGLTVAPALIASDSKSAASRDTKKQETKTENKAESRAESAASSEAASSSVSVAAPSQPAASSQAQAASQPEAPAESTAAPAPEASADSVTAKPEVPVTEPVANENAAIEEENSFIPILQQETEALAAEDPMLAPALQMTVASNGDTITVNEADDTVGVETEEGTIWMTPEEIRAALDAGTLDGELEAAGVSSENDFWSWLLNWFFGIEEKKEVTDHTNVPSAEPIYTGWVTKNGRNYYYDANTHLPLTGIQSIDNKLYYFDANGAQQDVTFGVDVSKYQSGIDWNLVKQAGVQFVIIRIGYRGYGTGALVLDPMFEEHFTNARNAGLRTGVYFFSQAVNENEAREEAQACLRVLNGRQLDYPIYFDTEASGSRTGRADGLGKTDRTKCAVAFCEEVRAAGYQPGVYASTTWFNKYLEMSTLTNNGYSIWNAHYSVPSSPIACNIWQGTCYARISGYGGQIDVNISYIG